MVTESSCYTLGVAWLIAVAYNDSGTFLPMSKLKIRSLIH